MEETTGVATTNGVTRSQDEIVARIAAVADDDFFGFAREVLIDALDFEHAAPYLKEGVLPEEWNSQRPADFAEEAREYLEFAVEKIDGHRGISASRSVAKLTEYAWLLGRDDVVAAMDHAHYPQYGAPKVKAFADGMGLEWPDDADLNRMAQGLPCEPDCTNGCGQ